MRVHFSEGGLAMAGKFSNSIHNPIFSDPNKNASNRSVVNISIDRLKPFPDHPFKPYKGQRLEDLIRSVRETGILMPIIVRRCDEENYEILSGHNRVNAAREAGLDKVPATVYEPENDEEAELIVVESNFNQRSATDMKHSELAKSLHMLNEAKKKQPGYRSDLQEVEEGSQIDNRSRTMHVIGEKYNLSQATIARYIRIAQLSAELLDCLDNRVIGLGVAERLSYLRPGEQEIVHQFLTRGEKVSLSQAQALKRESKKHELNEDEICQLLTSGQNVPKTRTIKLSEELFLQHFTQEPSPEEIERILAKALELYKSQNPL